MAIFKDDSEIMTILFNEEESYMTFFVHIINDVKWCTNGFDLHVHITRTT